jgi:hypothetical protein
MDNGWNCRERQDLVEAGSSLGPLDRRRRHHRRRIAPGGRPAGSAGPAGGAEGLRLGDVEPLVQARPRRAPVPEGRRPAPDTRRRSGAAGTHGGRSGPCRSPRIPPLRLQGGFAGAAPVRDRPLRLRPPGHALGPHVPPAGGIPDAGAPHLPGRTPGGILLRRRADGRRPPGSAGPPRGHGGRRKGAQLRVGRGAPHRGRPVLRTADRRRGGAGLL